MRVTRYYWALLTVIIYEILMRLADPTGVSVFKIAITLLVWISFYLAISTFFSHYRKIKSDIPAYAFYLFITIIGWNLTNIFRGALAGEEPITTQFGSNVTALALLVPFAIAFSAEEFNLRTINRLFTNLIFIGILAYFLFFAFSRGGSIDLNYNKAFSVLFVGVFFLIPIIPFQSGRIKLLIVLGSILLSYLAILTEYRVMILRILLLYLSIIVMYFYRWFNLKLILIVAMLSLLLPFYFFAESLSAGESVFQKYGSEIKDENLSQDTRTFLYVEVLDDLLTSNELIIGKGSSGRYYSTYFDEHEGDTAYRLSVEVGVLALLLKGGLIAVLLNLAILFIAIYLALFRANNYFVMCIGLLLIIHTLILFITNYLDYSSYNVALWFFIGVCLSRKMRQLDDSEIENILLYGSAIS